MARPSNREIELHFFEQFRSHYPLPEGEIEYGDKPDVLVRGMSSTLGIEIANLYVVAGEDENSEQVQAPRRAKVLERAHHLYGRAGGEPVELSVGFEPLHPVRVIEPLAEALAALANGLAGQPSGNVKAQLFENIPEVSSVYRYVLDRPALAWRLVQGFYVPVLSVERVREIVRGKSEKAKQYRACTAYWLLLVVDFMNAAQDQELAWPEAERLGASAFEKVLLYKPQFADVVEVPR